MSPISDLTTVRTEQGIEADGGRRRTLLSKQRLVGAAILLGILLLAAWSLEDALRPVHPVVMAVFLFTAILWGTVWWPPHVTVVLSLAILAVTGVTNAVDLAAGLRNPIMIMVLATFVYGEAVQKTGLGRRMALAILLRSGADSRFLVLTTFGVTFAFAFLVPSNIGRLAMIVPVVLGVAGVFEGETRKNLSKILMIGITLASTTASVAVVTGAGSTLYVAGLLSDLGPDRITYLTWLLWFAPPVIVFLLGLWWVLLQLFPLKDRTVPGGMEYLRGQVAALGGMAPAERRTIIILSVMLAGWMTERIHGVSMEIVAFMGAAFLVLPRVGPLTPAEGWATIRWDVPILFGGSMSLAHIVVKTGLVDRLAEWIFYPVPSRPILLLLACLVPLLVVLRLGFANVIGILATVLPVVLSAASAWNINALWIGLFAFPIMAPGMILPTQSPSSMVTYAFEAYSAADYRRVGVVATILLVLSFLLAALVYWPLLGLSWHGQL